MKKILIFSLILLFGVIFVSFFMIYERGEDVTIKSDQYITDDILIKLKSNDDYITLFAATVSDNTRLMIMHSGSRQGLFSPGFTINNYNNNDFNIKVYHKWLRKIWVPYQTIEIETNINDLYTIADDEKESIIKDFKAEYADKLIDFKMR